MIFDIHFENEVTSTNTILKNLAEAGIPEGYVLAAKSQTEGRGRLGRSFYSPCDSGLYFSLMLRPCKSVKPAALTCLTAVSLAEAVQSYGIDCRIKWVNDLYIGDKKVAGILAEGAFSPDGSLTYAVIGIGLNLYLPKSVPDELKDIITGLFQNQLQSADPDEMLNKILSRIDYYYEKLPDLPFWQTYRNLQNCFGKKVLFQNDGSVFSGTAEDIDSDFRLIVRTESGSISLDRGEVTFA